MCFLQPCSVAQVQVWNRRKWNEPGPEICQIKDEGRNNVQGKNKAVPASDYKVELEIQAEYDGNEDLKIL